MTKTRSPRTHAAASFTEMSHRRRWEPRRQRRGDRDDADRHRTRRTSFAVNVPPHSYLVLSTTP